MNNLKSQLEHLLPKIDEQDLGDEMIPEDKDR